MLARLLHKPKPAKEKPSIGELCCGFLFNGSDGCLASGHSLLRKCCDLMKSQILDICVLELSAKQSIDNIQKTSGKYDRDMVQGLLEQMGKTISSTKAPQTRSTCLMLF